MILLLFKMIDNYMDVRSVICGGLFGVFGYVYFDINLKVMIYKVSF